MNIIKKLNGKNISIDGITIPTPIYAMPNPEDNNKIIVRYIESGVKYFSYKEVLILDEFNEIIVDGSEIDDRNIILFNINDIGNTLGEEIIEGELDDDSYDYEYLLNKPRLNGIELIGDLPLERFGVPSLSYISDNYVRKENNKGLSTNDFLDKYKDFIDNATYKTPEITEFSITDFPKGYQEVGLTISGSKLVKHTFINEENIDYYITLKGSGIADTRLQLNQSSNVIFNLLANTIDRFEVSIETKDSRGTDIKEAVSFETIYPFYGGPGKQDINTDEILNLNKFMTKDLTNIYFRMSPTESTKYFWIVLPSEVNMSYVSVNGLYSVMDLPNEVNLINKYGSIKTYNAYRVLSELTVGDTYHVKVIM